MCACVCVCASREVFIRATWLIHTCTMTHSYVRHDSYIRVPWLIYMCAMFVTWLTHVRIWRGLGSWGGVYVCVCVCVCIPWSFHTCDVTHPWISISGSETVTHLQVWHDTWLIVTTLIHICRHHELIDLKITREMFFFLKGKKNSKKMHLATHCLRLREISGGQGGITWMFSPLQAYLHAYAYTCGWVCIYTHIWLSAHVHT